MEKARIEGALSCVKRERIQGCSPWPVLCLAVVVGFRVNCERRCGSSAPSPGSPTDDCAAWRRAAWSLRPPYLPTHLVPAQPKLRCRCRGQIDPACRFSVTQRDAHLIVAGRRMVAVDGGSGKSRHLGQIRVGTKSAERYFGKPWTTSGSTLRPSANPARCKRPKMIQPG